MRFLKFLPLIYPWPAIQASSNDCIACSIVISLVEQYASIQKIDGAQALYAICGKFLSSLVDDRDLVSGQEIVNTACRWLDENLGEQFQKIIPASGIDQDFNPDTICYQAEICTDMDPEHPDDVCRLFSHGYFVDNYESLAIEDLEPLVVHNLPKKFDEEIVEKFRTAREVIKNLYHNLKFGKWDLIDEPIGYGWVCEKIFLNFKFF